MRKKTIASLVAGWFMLGVLIGALIVEASSPTTIFYLSGGIYPGAPAYTVWREGTSYFAKSNNGRLSASGTNFTAIASYCVANMTAYGGIIHLEPGYYEGWVIINRDGVVLEGEGVFCNVPAGIPDNPPTLLNGTVLKVTTAGKDAIQITGQRYGVHIRDLGIWFTQNSTGCGITSDTTQTYTLTHCSFSNLKFLNCDKDSYALRFANFLDLDINNVMAWGGPLLNIYANKPNFQQGNSILSNLYGYIKYDLSPVALTAGPYPVWIHRNDSIDPTVCWTNFLTINRLQINNPTGSVDTDYYSCVVWDLRSSTITGLDLEGSNCQNHTLLVGTSYAVTFETPYLWEQTPNHAYVAVASNNQYITFIGGYIEGVLDSNYTDRYVGTRIIGPIDSNCAAAFPDLENNTGISTLTSGQSSVTVTARYIGLYDYVLVQATEATGLAAGESLKVDTINRAPTNTFVITCDDEGTASQDIVFYWKVVHNDAAP